jgi:hypothetical protein
MSTANIEMLERAAVALGDLVDDEVVFVGGATVGLWATDQATAEFRPTDDVDVIVEVASRNDYYRFEERLWALGFVNDDEDGVICRFRHRPHGLVLGRRGRSQRWIRDAGAFRGRCQAASRGDRRRGPRLTPQSGGGGMPSSRCRFIFSGSSGIPARAQPMLSAWARRSR